ncbi:MAG: putative lipopolysaccharide heptosyltransferase III [Deltaproteobacteria bacterium]|nr:putative lipopolysaccharide heptosyltransferase III [Deltaproteobacteria bacterium]
MHDTIDNILVIKLRHIGDVILTIPVFEALRYNYPDAFIAALVNEEAGPVLEHNPSVNRVFTLQRSSHPVHSFRRQLELMYGLRKQRFDLVLELSKNDRGAFYSFVTGAEKRLGFKSRKGKRVDRQLLFTDLVTPSGTQHIVDYHLEMIEKLALNVPGKDLALYWDQSEEDMCGRILEEEGIFSDDQFIVLHPFSRDRHKSWHVDSYAKICDYMSEQWGVRTVLIGGSDEMERSLVDRVAVTAKSSPINLGGRLSLKHLAAVSSRALLFVGIDSGPMHVASAVGTPVVAIFGPSRRFRWGPWGEGHEVIQKDWPCVPCGKKGCDGTGRSRCLDELSVEEVTAVLEPRMKSILSGRVITSGEKSV